MDVDENITKSERSHGSLGVRDFNLEREATHDGGENYRDAQEGVESSRRG